MKLICVGLLKTGTKSTASALRILGYNVHDLEEHWRYHLDEYVDAMEGKQIPDFARMYANVDAVIASPSYFFWEESFAAFPDAKVLLTVRDSKETWAESYEKTFSVALYVLSSLWIRLGFLCTPTGRKWKKIYFGVLNQLTSNQSNNRIAKPDVYTQHNARVKSSIPQDQLLVYNVKQGWKPLCEFLGVEVPNVPFPRLNVNSEMVGGMYYNSHVYKRMSKELVIILVFIVLLICAVLVYWLFLFGKHYN